MSLLAIIALTLVALVFAVAFWPSSKPEMVETTRTEAAIREELANQELSNDKRRSLEGELSYLRYIAKLTKSDSVVDSIG